MNYKFECNIKEPPPPPPPPLAKKKDVIFFAETLKLGLVYYLL